MKKIYCTLWGAFSFKMLLLIALDDTGWMRFMMNAAE